MCELWVIQFRQRKHSVQMNQLQHIDIKYARTNSKLTVCIYVWIVGDSQFRERKRSVEMNQFIG